MPATPYNAAIGYNAPISYLGDIFINVALTETATPGDSLSANAVMGVGLTESASPGDSLSGQADFAAALTESASPGSSLAASATYNVEIEETVTPGDELFALVLAATPSDRVYSVGGSRPATYIKDPDARLDYKIDWGGWLGSDVIASSLWHIGQNITAYAVANTPTSATIWLEGGVSNGEHRITNRIVTAAGRIQDQTLTFKIRNR